MMYLPASVRLYLCLTACDMRKSFDSLQALVRDYLELDVYAGHLFVFASPARSRENFVLGSRWFCARERSTRTRRREKAQKVEITREQQPKG